MTRDLCSTADNILSSKKCELAIYHLLHMDTKKPSTDNGFIRKHRLDEDTFLENFNNDLWPGKTCLCYEVTAPVGDTRVPLGQERGFLHSKVRDASRQALDLWIDGISEMKMFLQKRKWEGKQRALSPESEMGTRTTVDSGARKRGAMNECGLGGPGKSRCRRKGATTLILEAEERSSCTSHPDAPSKPSQASALLQFAEFTKMDQWPKRGSSKHKVMMKMATEILRRTQ
ncbi:DNA dC-_dU-editing enzyme APOBEC-3A [Manis javanica]|nr:DNA dC->dU-editing enzyme APOBEC-3A [Manis javanica]